jgi:hypothetical protein
MIRISIFLLVFCIFLPGTGNAQAFIKTGELFHRQENNRRTGNLNINQDVQLDSLISRYIIANSKVKTYDGSQGISGFRIQIYSSSVRTAREGSAKAQADFINKFPSIESYPQFQDPGYFMVRVGDYRSRAEGFKDLLMIRKEFPNAYLVPDVINFPDLNKQ